MQYELVSPRCTILKVTPCVQIILNDFRKYKLVNNISLLNYPNTTHENVCTQYLYLNDS